MSEMDTEAAHIGAVNVIKIIRDKNGDIRLKGYNSDAMGFQNSIAPLINPKRNRALILGTGGRIKGYQPRPDKPRCRTCLRVTYTCRGSAFLCSTHTGSNGKPQDHSKLHPRWGCIQMLTAAPDIPYDLLTPDHLCYDLIYNPDVTTFMKKSRAYGAEVKNGLEMLLLQAFESWNIWNM